jgi:hypothetical protein
MAELMQAGRVEDVECNITTMLLAAAPANIISGARVSLMLGLAEMMRMVDGSANIVATGQCLILQWATKDIVVSFVAPQRSVVAAFAGFTAGSTPPLRVWEEAASLGSGHKLMLTDVPLRDHMSGLVAGYADFATSTGVNDRGGHAPPPYRRDMHEDRNKINELERRVGSVLTTRFDDAPTMTGRFKVR